MFGFTKKERTAKRQPRYTVRQDEAPPQRYHVLNKYTDEGDDYPGWKWLVFDSETGTFPYFALGISVNQTAKKQADERARVLNAENGQEALQMPYIFDCLLARKVYEDPSVHNCRDHAAALNQADQDTRERSAESRWQPVALALIRATLDRHPMGWVVRDTGLTIEVRSPDGQELIASCDTYADAASIQALGEIALTDLGTFTPNQHRELAP